MVIIAKLGYLLTRVALPPLTLRHVSLEEYGLWSATFVLIGYLGMSGVGISNVYIRYVAEFHARGEKEKIDRLLTTGMTTMAVLGVGLLLPLWRWLPTILSKTAIPERLVHRAFVLMFGAATIFMLDLSIGAFAYVLLGLRRVKEQTAVWVASFLLETVLIVILLERGHGVIALLEAFAVRYLFAVGCLAVLGFRLLPGLSLRPANFDPRLLRLFFGYGAVVQLSCILGMFLYSLEKLLAGIFLGAKATGVLEIGEKLPTMASQLPATMTGLFLPTLAHLQTNNDEEGMRRLYLRGSRSLNLLSGLLLGFPAAFAPPLIAAWIGADVRLTGAAAILTIMCLPYQMHELTGPASAMHRAMGRPARELVYPLSQILLIALILGGLTLSHDLTLILLCGVVGSGMITSSLLYLAWTNRILGIGQAAFFRSVVLPGLLPYVIGPATATLLPQSLLAGSRPTILTGLGMAGVIYLLLTLLGGYRWILDYEERALLRSRLALPARFRQGWRTRQ